MNQFSSNTRIPMMEKVRWAAYGLVVGLVLGVMMGWIFHVFVGAIVRLVILLIILAPFVAAFLFWQKVKSTKRPSKSESVVRDADWREVGPKR